MERSVRNRLILGHVSIAIVIALSTATAFVALGSTVQQGERTTEIDRRLTALEQLRADTRALARSARRYLLTGDLKEKQRVYAIEREMKTLSEGLRTGSRSARTTLDASLDQYATTVVLGMSADRDDPATTLTRFEDELSRARNPLAMAFDDVIARERSQLDASRSTQRFARGARWALLVTAALGISLAVGSLIAVMRLLASVALRRRATEDMAERVARSRTELLAASDELRTPLHEIVNQCAQLRAKTDTDVERIATIERSATRVARLVVDVLDVSGLQSGTASLRRESCAAASLVDRAIKHHRTTALDRGIRLRFEAQPALSVSADRERMTHVLTSLLERAIASARIGAEIVLSVEATNDGVGFAIVDSAFSVVPDQVAVVSAPAAASSTNDLTLHLCQRVIEAHGGRMGVATAGAGRSYWFTLPTEPSLLR